MSLLLEEITGLLQQAGIAEAHADAARIVKTANFASPSGAADKAREMAAMRAAGQPLAYVTGYGYFMGVELVVAEGALVPREETQLLGHAALDEIHACDAPGPRVIDMCCGSGNLACAIAYHVPDANVWASDLTDGCVSVARRNVAHVGVSGRVVVAQGDLFSGLAGFGLEGSTDVVVCNPPYISQGKLATERVELLQHEPREAFDGGPYGLSIHQRVIKEALPFLRVGGMLLFEIGVGQERQVKMLFDRSQSYDDIRMLKNPAGEVRVVTGRKI